MNRRLVSTILCAALVASCVSDDAADPASSAPAASPATASAQPADTAAGGVDDSAETGTDSDDSTPDSTDSTSDTTDATAGTTGSTPGTADAPTIDEWLGVPVDRSPEELLAAFSAVFGDVPDVDPIAIGDDGTPGTRTSLVEQVLLRLDDYNDAQLDSIGALLRPDGIQFSVPSASAGFSGVGAFDDESDARTMVELAMAEISGRTGRAYDGRIEVVLVDRPEVSTDTWAEAVAATGLGGIDGLHPLQVGATASATCYIFLGRLAIGGASGVAHEKVAHEVFHCFQYQAFNGDFDQFGALPAWQKEGSAAWAGLTLSGGASNSQSDSWWREYLVGNSPAGAGGYSLRTGNGYAALGLFEFLAQHGVDVWAKILPQLNAGNSSTAFGQLTGDDGELMSAWASATLREGFSAAWDMTGPGITSDHRVPRRETLTTTSIVEEEFGNLNNSVLMFDVDADVEYALVGVDGVGRISWEGEHERPLINSRVRYCFLDDCLCPDGRPPFDGAPYEQLDRGIAWAGLGSFSTVNTHFRATGLTKEDVCEPCPGEGGGAGFRSPSEDCPDPCLTGKWQQDTGVMETEFRRLLPREVESVSIEGANVVEFRDGAVTVTWGTTITAVIPLEDGLVLTFVESFGGDWSGTYDAVAGQLTAETVSTTLALTITSYINGSASPTTTTSPDPFSGAEMTYECVGNELTLHPAETSVINAFDRINPTE